MPRPTTMLTLADLGCDRKDSLVWTGTKGAYAPEVSVESLRITNQPRAYIRCDNRYNVGITLL